MSRRIGRVCTSKSCSATKPLSVREIHPREDVTVCPLSFESTERWQPPAPPSAAGTAQRRSTATVSFFHLSPPSQPCRARPSSHSGVLASASPHSALLYPWVPHWCYSVEGSSTTSSITSSPRRQKPSSLLGALGSSHRPSHTKNSTALTPSMSKKCPGEGGHREKGSGGERGGGVTGERKGWGR